MNPSTSLSEIFTVFGLVLIVAVLAWRTWKNPPDWFTSWLETRDERAIAMRTADADRVKSDVEELLVNARNKGVM